MLGADIAKAALTYVGTPYHQNGRVKGVGVDCVGLAICAARDAGLPVPDHVGPTDGDRLDAVLGGLQPHCDSVIGSLELGDFLVFRSRSIPQHLGIYVGEGRIVHAYDSPAFNAVIIEDIEPRWGDRLAFVFRVRGGN